MMRAYTAFFFPNKRLLFFFNYRFFFFFAFGRKNSGEVERNIEAKMPSEFVGKKNCPYPLRGLIHYESYFFYMQYIHNVYHLFIFELNSFSLSLFSTDLL